MVTFYEIGENEQPGAPVLYLDTLKVSTTEQTAENTSARGGKGNPELIMWDYGKEITVNLEDALFSAKSMALMYGVDPKDTNEFGAAEPIRKTIFYTTDESVSTNAGMIKIADHNPKYYDDMGNELTKGEDNKFTRQVGEETVEATPAYIVLTINVDGQEIVISSDRFPGTYYVTGDTYARSEATGKDECFQFIIPKAKVLSEVTLTMEAEGDPSTFSMNLKVLRPKSGKMMKLVKYSLPEDEASGDGV